MARLQSYGFCSSGMQPLENGGCYLKNSPPWGPDEGDRNRYYQADAVDAEIARLKRSANDGEVK